MNKKEKKLIEFCNDLIFIFTDYVNVLDAYFNTKENKKEHLFLYGEYQELGRHLRDLEVRYKK